MTYPETVWRVENPDAAGHALDEFGYTPPPPRALRISHFRFDAAAQDYVLVKQFEFTSEDSVLHDGGRHWTLSRGPAFPYDDEEIYTENGNTVKIISSFEPNATTPTRARKEVRSAEGAILERWLGDRRR